MLTLNDTVRRELFIAARKHYLRIAAPTRSEREASADMSESITVTIPHRLGKEEALRRMKAGFTRIRERLGALIAIDQETWDGNTVQFQMRGMGQTASGRMIVLDDNVHLDVTLPWLLARLAQTLLPALRKETAKLLGPPA